jgi:hypothetical protein
VAEQFYDSIFDIHGKGVLYTARQSFPLLPKGASIILNLSIFGVKGLSSKSVYSKIIESHLRRIRILSHSPALGRRRSTSSTARKDLEAKIPSYAMR